MGASEGARADRARRRPRRDRGGVAVRGATPERRPKMMMSRQGFIRVVAVAAVLGCWAGTTLAQPFLGGLPQCQANLNTCNVTLTTCTTQLAACRQTAPQTFPATGQTACW